MKKACLVFLVLCLSLTLFGCRATPSSVSAAPNPTPSSAKSDDSAVADLVKEFGSKLQLVSLLAPKEVAAKSVQEQYGSYLSPALLSKWQADPQTALGRMTSSPWPDRIEIKSAQAVSVDTYDVKGEIIEVTSVEKQSGGFAAKRPFSLIVKRINGRWLIDSVTSGEYLADTATYKNTQYGFSFALPKGWQGYTIVTNKWEGLPVGGQSPIATGAMLAIRHPQWSAEVPRQDIPIMIFTLKQWDSLQKGEFHIGAAPIGPRELNRNTEFVFALPARYNYAFPLGYEEVERIIASNPLQPLAIVSGK
ncbi:MAG: hypothetical protein ACM3ZQ_02165 [Bacillota bacterium]